MQIDLTANNLHSYHCHVKHIEC